jgi:hypothetical protein
MEIRFLREMFTEKDSKLLMDHVQRMASGEAPFFPKTLGLVYYKLAKKPLQKHTPSGFGPGNPAGGQRLTNPTSALQGSTSTPSITSSPTPNVASSCTSNVVLPSTSNVVSSSTSSTSSTLPCRITRSSTIGSTNLQAPPCGITRSSAIGFASSSNLRAPTPNPRLVPPIKRAGLECVRCGRVTLMGNLHDGLHCPHCPQKGKNGKGKAGRPFMICMGCRALRDRNVNICFKSKCGSQFW